MISDMDLEENRNIPVFPVFSMDFPWFFHGVLMILPVFPQVFRFSVLRGGSRRMGRIPALELHPMPMDDGLSASDGGETKGMKHQKSRFPITNDKCIFV